MAKSIKNSPKILGLDVSTKTIGMALFDMSSRDLLELTHISPRPKPVPDNKMEDQSVVPLKFVSALHESQRFDSKASASEANRLVSQCPSLKQDLREATLAQKALMARPATEEAKEEQRQIQH